jgi:hypothetical protein
MRHLLHLAVLAVACSGCGHGSQPVAATATQLLQTLAKRVPTLIMQLQ